MNSICLMLLALAPQSGGLASGFTKDTPLPHTQGTKQVSRTIAGDLTHDLRPDVVMLQEGDVVLAYGVDTFQTTALLPTSAVGTEVRDIEWYPNADGTLSLLSLAAEGLRKVDYDPDTQQFSSTTSMLAEWNSARAIRRADLGGSSLPDYVSVSASGSRIQYLVDYTGTTGTELAKTVVGAPILEVEPIDWSGAAPDEISVRLATSVRVYSSSGACLFSASASGGTRVLEPVRCTGESDERLAYVEVTSGTGDDWLIVVGSTAATSSLHLGAFGITAAGAGDPDGDGDTELMLSHEANHQRLLLMNQSGATPFVLEGVGVYVAGPTTPAPGNRSEPCFDDFDGDADQDLAVAVQSGNTLRVHRNDLVDEIDQWVIMADRPDNPYLTPDVAEGDVTLEFDVFHPIVGGSFDSIEVMLWRQADIDTYQSGPTPTHHFTQVMDAGSESAMTVELNEPYGFDSIYHFLLRAVEVVDGKVVASGPTGTFTYTMRSGIWQGLKDALPPQLQWGNYTPPGETQSAAYGGGGSPSGGPPPPAAQ